MNWQEIYPQLKDKKSKSQCLAFAIACCDAGAVFTQNQLILDLISKMKSFDEHKEEMKNKFYEVCLIRVRAGANTNEKEAAHILIHAIEVAMANNYVSAAGHSARCGNALSRIDALTCAELVSMLEK
jgi:hypothetical protein